MSADLRLPESLPDARLALEYAVARFSKARDDLGNVRGQLAHEEASHYLGAYNNGVSSSVARELARANTAALRDQLHDAEAAVDIWRAHIDAITLAVTHFLT